MTQNKRNKINRAILNINSNSPVFVRTKLHNISKRYKVEFSLIEQIYKNLKKQKNMKAFEIKNYRQIKVKFLPATNTSGSRIKIYEPKRYNDQKTQSKTFSYNHEIGDVCEQAYQILIKNGFNVICRASEFENYIFLCDNWGEDYLEIKDLKQ